jgi:hypothetical protein
MPYKSKRKTFSIKLNTQQVTTDLLAYLRFQKHIFLLATEVANNGCVSDVLALDGKAIVEFEVKISTSDFKKDFEKELVGGTKKSRSHVLKHSSYSQGGSFEDEDKIFCPHFFYFAVPMIIVPFVREYCKDYPNYGIIGWSKDLKNRISTIKPARLLNNDPPNKLVVRKILKRATSELIKVRDLLYSNQPGVQESEDYGYDILDENSKTTETTVNDVIE